MLNSAMTALTRCQWTAIFTVTAMLLLAVLIARGITIHIASRPSTICRDTATSAAGQLPGLPRAAGDLVARLAALSPPSPSLAALCPIFHLYRTSHGRAAQLMTNLYCDRPRKIMQMA